MTEQSMTYSEFDRALTGALPELKSRVERKTNQQAEAGPQQPYALVVLVLKPLLREQLDSQNDIGFLRRIFDFFEEMACSPDIQVVNLLQVGIFESLVREPDRLALAWKYMGKETKAVARRTARTWNREGNLPAG